MSPEFSEQTKKALESIISRYPHREAALLPALHLAQREFGYVSPETEKLVASLLNLKPLRVREVVTFYTMFNRKPVGKYQIQVCANLSCTLLGAESILNYLTKKLKVMPGETTEDRKFTLAAVQCLGACEQAPCMMVNFDYYGNLDKKKVDQILGSLE